jgi:hypothetical protein
VPVTDPANQSGAPGEDTPGGNVPGSATEQELKRSGLGWRHILMITGAGMFAAGAGVWRMRRTR